MKFEPSVRLGFVTVVLIAATGCGRTLSSLYEDYRIEDAPLSSIEVYEAIKESVVEAGWTLGESPAPNVISTEEATVSQWGLYKVVVSIDVAPISGKHVRVFFHPYRVYLWGARSKMPYLSRRVRNFVLPDLTTALAKHDIVALDVDLAEQGAGD